MIRRQSLWCPILRPVGIVAGCRNTTILISCWGVMARLNNTFPAGFHGYRSQVVGPGRANLLHGARFPWNNAVDIIGSSGGSRINVGVKGGLSLKGCADHTASDGHGLHNRRVDDKFLRKQPPCALSPLPYPQLLRNYSDDARRLEEDRDATTKKRSMMMNGHGEMFDRGSPLGSLNRPLPDKLVVAVDVDEGGYPI